MESILNTPNVPKSSFLIQQKTQFLNGRQWQQTIADIRNDGYDGTLTIEEIYSADPELLDWYTRTDPNTTADGDRRQRQAYRYIFWFKRT